MNQFTHSIYPKLAIGRFHFSNRSIEELRYYIKGGGILLKPKGPIYSIIIS